MAFKRKRPAESAEDAAAVLGPAAAPSENSEGLRPLPEKWVARLDWTPDPGDPAGISEPESEQTSLPRQTPTHDDEW